jgi:uncharacterized protein (UPF0179 family)
MMIDIREGNFYRIVSVRKNMLSLCKITVMSNAIDISFISYFDCQQCQIFYFQSKVYKTSYKTRWVMSTL